MIKRVCCLWAVLALTGCATVTDTGEKVSNAAQQKIDQKERQVTTTTDQNSPVPNDPYYAPVEPSAEAQHVIPTGSAFNPNLSNSLYSSTTSHQIGDTVTILLTETASAQKSASTSMSHNNDYNLDPITVPGGQLTVNGNTVQLGVNQSQNFDGQADSSQSHTLNGQITVSVVDVLNNGNLVVRGEKWLVINNGKEYIRLTGIVRPKDISQGNTVRSSQVADARIEFSGTGDQANSQTQGWLSRLFNGSLWPF
ncbi:flagellar basal body L-ring protein FlgH [Celerinatantimonas sp. YJH-8]|uniref:flagellar basal body L-ring protein FlgH n=1 Tax=Celerinatantimonas sp. YJH-8 TaxID=3228714 RepID=UPI0038BF7362